MPKPIPASSSRIQSAFSSSFESLNLPSSPELALIYKKCLKQNSNTLIKALQDLLDRVQSSTTDEMIAFLPFWQQLWSRLLLNYDRRIRLLVFQVHKSILEKVGKQMALVLKSIMGLWLTSCFDSQAIANSANETLVLAFGTKVHSAIEFCLQEVLDFIQDHVLYQTVESLSDARFVHPLESQETYARIISGAIQTCSLILKTCAWQKHQEALFGLLSESKLWKFTQNESPWIRLSMYNLVKTMVELKLEWFKEHLDMVSKSFLNKLFSDTDGSNQPSVWETLLILTRDYPQSWILASQSKSVLKKFLMCLKGGLNGHGQVGYPCILPLISVLPRQWTCMDSFVSDITLHLWQGCVHQSIHASFGFSCFFEVGWYFQQSSTWQESFKTFLAMSYFVDPWKDLESISNQKTFMDEWIRSMEKSKTQSLVLDVIPRVISILGDWASLDVSRLSFVAEFLKKCKMSWKDSLLQTVWNRELQSLLIRLFPLLSQNSHESRWISFYHEAFALKPSELPIEEELKGLCLNWIKKTRPLELQVSEPWILLNHSLSLFLQSQTVWDEFTRNLILSGSMESLEIFFTVCLQWHFSCTLCDSSLAHLTVTLLDTHLEDLDCIHKLLLLKSKDLIVPRHVLDPFLSKMIQEWHSMIWKESDSHSQYLLLFQDVDLNQTVDDLSILKDVYSVLLFLFCFPRASVVQESQESQSQESPGWTEMTIMQLWNQIHSLERETIKTWMSQTLKEFHGLLENLKVVNSFPEKAKFLNTLISFYDDSERKRIWKDLVDSLEFPTFWHPYLTVLHPQFSFQELETRTSKDKKALEFIQTLHFLPDYRVIVSQTTPLLYLDIYCMVYESLCQDMGLFEGHQNESFSRQSELSSLLQDMEQAESLFSFALEKCQEESPISCLALEFILKTCKEKGWTWAHTWMPEIDFQVPFTTYCALTWVIPMDSLFERLGDRFSDKSHRLCLRNRYAMQDLVEFRNQPAMGLEQLESLLEDSSHLEHVFLYLSLCESRNDMEFDFLSWIQTLDRNSLSTMYFLVKWAHEHSETLPWTESETFLGLIMDLVLKYGCLDVTWNLPLEKFLDVACQFVVPESLLARVQSRLEDFYNMLYSWNASLQVLTFSLLQRVALIQVQEWNLLVEMSRLEPSQVSFAKELELKLTLSCPLEHPYDKKNVGGYLLSWLLLVGYLEDLTFELKSNWIMEIRKKGLVDPVMALMNDLLFSPPLSNETRDKRIDWSKLNFQEYYIQGFDSSWMASSTLCAHLYYRLLMTCPSLVRLWWTECSSRQVSLAVKEFTAKYYTLALLQALFESLNARLKEFQDLAIKTNKKNEVYATFAIEDSQLELVITFPLDYPLRQVEIQQGSGKIPGIVESKWRSWLLQATALMTSQNGSLVDALKLFKKNVDLHFEGVEDCAICYSIIGVMDNTIPSKQCKNCKHKFHAACLFKWFNTSHQSTCPLCRQSSF